MCEIFPEVENFCLCATLRVGMIFIAILAIMTGVVGLCSLERQNNANFETVKNITEISKIKATSEALAYFSTAVPTGITLMSTVFMLAGLLLLFGNLTDQEGLIQLFVWITFYNVLFGFLLVFGVAVECVMKDRPCLFSGMDWLSASVCIVFMVAYLSLWIYFISVANSYVLNVTV